MVLSACASAGYNRGVRIGCIFVLFLSLTACNRGGQNTEAVKQGMLDYLANRKDLNIGSMDVTVNSVQFNGNKADANVSFSPKGTPASSGMSMRYQLEQQGSKWVVVGREDSGHAGSVAPGSGNPHGGGEAEPASPHGAGSGGVHMPSPEDLPPTGGKK
jgi:hypothetical protein